MYNIVRHLVEGREGIETFNLSKTEHLNAYANQIRTSSFSVCCVCVCVCVCCSHSFGFGFGYFCSCSHSRLAFGSCSCSCSCSCSSAAWYSFFSVFVFASRSVSFACVFNTILFLCCKFCALQTPVFQCFFLYLIFVLCFCLYCGILANNFTTAWVHKTSVEFDGWVLFNAAGGRAQGLLFLPE